MKHPILVIAHPITVPPPPIKLYCVTCRALKITEEYEQITMSNGKAAIKSKCPVCGTGMYKLSGIESVLDKIKTPTLTDKLMEVL